MTQNLGPFPPCEIRAEKFMKPLGLTHMKLAQAIDIPQSRLSDIARGRRSITADTALRLATYFETSPDMWPRIKAMKKVA